MRINENIKVSELRLIGPNAEQMGIVTLDEALAAAVSAGLDLCEISATARPPVCKLMDFGKYKYEMQKKQKEARKKQKVIQVKEVKLSPKITEHDMHIKRDHVNKFLAEGDKVKVTMVFRGRQNARPEIGQQMMRKLVEEMRPTVMVDRELKTEGNTYNVIFAPPSV